MFAFTVLTGLPKNERRQLKPVLGPVPKLFQGLLAWASGIACSSTSIPSQYVHSLVLQCLILRSRCILPLAHQFLHELPMLVICGPFWAEPFETPEPREPPPEFHLGSVLMIF